MTLVSRFTAVSIAFLFSSVAAAKSEGYQAGYVFGQAIGLFLPYAAAAVLVVGAWIAWRMWTRRGGSNDQQV